MDRFEHARQAMVEKFVLAAGIQDPLVVQAMGWVPRHLFVNPALAEQAYQGKSLPIGWGQTISHPTTVAFMCSLLEAKPGHKVLEIGTGSGYNAAVLAAMGCRVFSVERLKSLAEKARRTIEALGLHAVAVRQGDGSHGWPEFAPYDRIVVTAACAEVPRMLLNQLGPEGRLVFPLGGRTRQELVVLTRKHGEFVLSKKGPSRFVPLIGKSGWLE